ncbi:MAG: hypothetical protein JSS51_12655 [Planctomycetes bacterium]|nr:hypothetical protein [Planctomycetota bacterium]
MEGARLWLGDGRPRALCPACKRMAIEAQKKAFLDDATRAAFLKFEEVTDATQEPRDLSPQDVSAKLAMLGIECEHLEYVLALAVDRVSDVRAIDDDGEFVMAVEAIRHLRTVTIGRMSDPAEAKLSEAIQARLDFARLTAEENTPEGEPVPESKEIAKLERMARVGTRNARRVHGGAA